MEEVKEIKEFKILLFLDRFKNLFEKTGVKYNIMRRLLQIMLIMDSRKTTIMGSQRKASKVNGDSSPFSAYILSYGLLGIFIMILMFLPFSLFYKMSLCFGMVIFMLMTTMISDFSSVLLDVRDKIILVPKPIDSKTLNAAKTIHIIIYLIVISAAIAGPSLVVGTIKYGLMFFVIFFIQLVFIVMFVIFLTSIFYFLILQFFDGEKLKDIINLFQIILSVAMTIGYQFLGRAFNLLKTDFAFTPKWWTYVLPPMWFSAPYSYFLENNRQSVYVVLGLMGLLIPVALLILYYIKIAPYFEKSLQKLSSSGAKKSAFIEGKGKLKRRFTNIICRRKLDNIFYRFTSNMISNERQLKLKLYPSLAYAAVFPFIFFINMFSRSSSIQENLSNVKSSENYLYMYFAIMLLANLYATIYSSEKYKSSWIYKALPLKDPSPVFKGSLKCFLAKFVLPIFLFLSFILCLLFGAIIIPHLIVMFLSLIILTLVNFKAGERKLPFSIDFLQQNKEQQTGTGCLMVMVNGLCCAIGAAVEYLVSKTHYGIYVYIAVLLAVMLIMWNMFLNIKWADIVEAAE